MMRSSFLCRKSPAAVNMASSSVSFLSQSLRFGSSSSGSGRNRNKTRSEQIDKIFQSRSRHADERRRVVSAESDARGRPQLQRAQHKVGGARPVTLLDDPDEEQGLFRPASFDTEEQHSDGSTRSALQAMEATSTTQDSLLSFSADEGGAGAKSDSSILVDDAFSYLPEVDPEPAAVPGESFAMPGLTRYRFDVQFRGNHFFGWDRKAEIRHNKNDADGAAAAAAAVAATMHAQSSLMARSVRNAIEDALLAALDLSKFPSDEGIVPCCILETGVHAKRLTCHVDLPSDIVMQPRTILQRAHLWLHKQSDPLAILNFTPAPRGFHARHSVKRRVFVYRMLNRVAPPLFDLGLQWHVDRSLDVARMNEACQFLQGRQDYIAFADPKLVPQLLAKRGAAVRDVEQVRVTRQEDEVFLWFVGKSFLRHQLRYMASVLKLVGQGQWNDDTLEHYMKGPGEHTANMTLTTAQTGTTPLMSWKHLQPVPAPAHGLWMWSADFVDADPEAEDDDGSPQEGKKKYTATSAPKFVDSGLLN